MGFLLGAGQAWRLLVGQFPLRDFSETVWIR